jgi:hypothetical protein
LFFGVKGCVRLEKNKNFRPNPALQAAWQGAVKHEIKCVSFNPGKMGVGRSLAGARASSTAGRWAACRALIEPSIGRP